MAAGDMGGLLDAAAVADAGAAPAEVTTGAENTGAENTGAENTGAEKTGAEGKDGVDGEQGGEKNPDGSPKAKADALDDAKSVTPQSVRNTLKGLRDSVQDPESPEGKATLEAVKQLHGHFERWNAAKEIFPKGVAEMKEAKAFITEIGGREGYTTMQETVNQINETDNLLYSGDPKLIENIVSDLKESGKIDALGKMAPAFMEALKANDAKGYVSTIAGIMASELQTAELPQAVNQLWRALEDGDIDRAKALTKGVAQFYKGLQDKSAEVKKAALDPEKQQLAKERQEFETGKVKETQTAIATSAEKLNNTVLGSELKHFLRTPFFKQFSRENLVPLGNAIKSDLYQTLKADKAYQAQMTALWAKPKENAAKIQEYHKAKVESLAANIVQTQVQRMYPNYAKGGAVAGRVAEADAKKAATAKANATSVSQGKPIFVATKPKLDEIDWSKDPKEYLHIAGKAYLKSGKFVTWRK